MTGFDYFVLIVIGLSVAIGSMRGAIKEVMNLAGWMISFASANFFGGMISQYLPSFIPGANFKLIVGFALMFIITLILMGLLSSFLSEFITVIGLGWLDKILGVIFGLIRAVVIIVAVVLVIGLTSYPKTPSWQNGTFTMPFEAITLNILPYLPDFVSKKVKFE